MRAASCQNIQFRVIRATMRGRAEMGRTGAARNTHKSNENKDQHLRRNEQVPRYPEQYRYIESNGVGATIRVRIHGGQTCGRGFRAGTCVSNPMEPARPYMCIHVGHLLHLPLLAPLAPLACPLPLAARLSPFALCPPWSFKHTSTTLLTCYLYACILAMSNAEHDLFYKQVKEWVDHPSHRRPQYFASTVHFFIDPTT